MQPEQQPDTSADGPKPPRAKVIRPADETARLKRVVRAVLVGIAVVLAGVFATAAYINPYTGDGNAQTSATHTQLGMPPCNFKMISDKGCPSCGMTTSFALLVRGDVSASLRANWVGTIICVLWALTLVWAVASAAWGRMLLLPNRRGAGEMVFTAITGCVVVLMLGRWGALMMWG